MDICRPIIQYQKQKRGTSADRDHGEKIWWVEEKEKKIESRETTKEMRIGWSLLATNTSGVHPLSCLPRWPPGEHYHSVRGTVVCVYVRVEHNVQLGVLTPRPVYRGNAIPIPGLWQRDSIESDSSSSGRHASVDFNPPGLCLVAFGILSFSRPLDARFSRS